METFLGIHVVREASSPANFPAASVQSESPGEGKRKEKKLCSISL